MTPTVKSLLSQLEFVGRCPAGKKIDLVGTTYTDSNRVTWDTVARWLNNGSRQQTAETLDDLLQRVETETMHIQDRKILQLFAEALNKFIGGVQNLQVTYGAKPYFTIQSDQTIKHAQIILKNLQGRISEDGTPLKEHT